MKNNGNLSKKGCIRAERLKFRYFEKSKRNILDDVSIEFPGEKVTVILGSSGCGKSTLASVICGLYPENGGVLESGTVTVDGENVLDMPYGQRCRRIGAMFQNPDLQFCMSSLRQELYFCLENIKTPRENMDEIIADAASKYGVENLLDRQFASLSGGEKQKAALTCLFIIQPKVLVLDEPFANLDPDAVKAYISLLRKRIADEGLTVIAIDHKASNWIGTADFFLPLDDTCHPAAEEMLIPANELKHKADLLKKLGIENPYEDTVAKKSINIGSDEVLTLDNAGIFHNKKHNNSSGGQLTGVSLAARRGEIIACLGPSGSGKTTFLLALLKQKYYEGSIRIHGIELRKLKRKKLYSQIGIVFQNPAVQFVTTAVHKEVEVSLKKRSGQDTAIVQNEVNTLLEEFNLHHYRRYSPFMLSQGQQRRLAVLAMLAGGQDILLLDEPTYGQDERTTEAVMEQVCARSKKGTTVIFTTHDRRLACKYADRVWYFSDNGVSEADKEDIRKIILADMEAYNEAD